MSLITHFPARRQEQPFFYLDHGLWLFTVPPYGKSTYVGSHGHLDATNDPARVREMQREHRDGVWAVATEPSLLDVWDLEQREIRGQDGTISLRRHAESLGYTTSLIPLGETPIAISLNGGIHVYTRRRGEPLASRPVLPYVEIKSRGSSVRLPDAPGRRWDPSSLPHLSPIPTPDWVLELAQSSAPSREPLLPEGPLDGHAFTPIGHQVATRIIDKALDRARGMADARAAAKGLAWLVRDDRISPAYGRRIVERLAEEIPAFQESGFRRTGLRRHMLDTFEKGQRHG
jgi:hypothetical protein